MTTTEPTPETPRPVVDRFGPWVAMFAAVGLTASGEYALARMVGFPWWIAWAFPVAVDVYVVQAIRRRRDVAGAIALTIATQALYHLGDVGLFGVDSNGLPEWWLIVGVSAIAPVIVLRVHRITEPRPEVAAKTAADGVPVVGAESPEIAPAAELDWLPATDNSPVPAATELPEASPTTGAPEPTTGGDKTATDGDQEGRQEVPIPAAKTVVEKAATKRSPVARGRAAKKAPRRSLDEWVDAAGPIFHSEFARLRRNPTANEFATAIGQAGLGLVSDSTAKNIRAEILDRTELPALD